MNHTAAPAPVSVPAVGLSRRHEGHHEIQHHDPSPGGRVRSCEDCAACWTIPGAAESWTGCPRTTPHPRNGSHVPAPHNRDAPWTVRRLPRWADRDERQPARQHFHPSLRYPTAGLDHFRPAGGSAVQLRQSWPGSMTVHRDRFSSRHPPPPPSNPAPPPLHIGTGGLLMIASSSWIVVSLTISLL